MILHNVQDERSDIWGLGILLYELLHGISPFKSDNSMNLFQKVMKTKDIYFDPKLSKDVIDLIQKILQRNPTERITLDEIYNHNWIRKYELFFNDSLQIYSDKIKNPNEKQSYNPNEEGFSPENSPTRKLKNKRLFKEENIEIKEESKIGIEIENSNDNSFDNESFFHKVLRRLGKFCKC